MNNFRLFFLALAIVIPLNMQGQESNQKDIAVTVYNNNLGVVKDVRELDLKSGLSQISITDVAKLIDPTSVHINLNGEVIEQNYQYDLVNFYKISMHPRRSAWPRRNAFISGPMKFWSQSELRDCLMFWTFIMIGKSPMKG